CFRRLCILIDNKEKAIFAGGCFWCMVEPFDERPGIYEVISGYTGGTVENPTYREVCSDQTGHVEAVEITYDPNIVAYEDLVTLFWQQIDPTDAGGQFHDRETSNKTAKFYVKEQKKEIAEKPKAELEASGKLKNPIEHQFCLLNLFIKQKRNINIIIKRINSITIS